MENNNNDNWLFEFFIGFVQMLDFMLNVTQVSNDELLKHLQQQDGVLNEQTNKYLKKILENQKKIIDILNNNKMEH